MWFILLLHTRINVSFTLVISRGGLFLLPLTSKGVNISIYLEIDPLSVRVCSLAFN
jgi:hypothetical protein